METLGLIAAMPQESDALLRRLNGWKRMDIGPFRGCRFVLSGRTCVLVTSGMGIRRAREAARALVGTVAPQILVSFGIAGAIEADLEIGDVVTADSVCELSEGNISPLQPLARWPEGAHAAMTQALTGRGAHLFSGTAVTTRGSQFVQYRPGELMHPILEMETAGIAQVATEKGIPFLSIRAISDGPRAPIPIDLGEMMNEDANLKVGKMLAALVRHPGIIFKSGQMMRNTRIAADNAAIALLAALGCSDSRVLWN